MTANELTKATIKALENLPNVEVWRANNISIPGRRFIGKKGLPDINGYIRGGKCLYIEVKADGDRLSDHQRNFLRKVKDYGGYAFVVSSLEDIEHITQILQK